MPNPQGTQLFKTRNEVASSMVDAWLLRIPDARVDSDSNARLIFEVFAQEVSGNYIAAELLFKDIWPQTADAVSLLRFGEEFNYPIKGGVTSKGSLRISGEGGTFIPAGSQFAALLIQSEPYLFSTTESGTIPAPGIPDAPLAEDAAVAGALTGTMEYAITFTTLEGETEIGADSGTLELVASKANLTLISLGGTGTIGRNIYRREDGGDWKFVATLANNTVTTYLDNIATGALGSAPPTASTAERITLAAEATEVGIQYNVAPRTITILSDVPDGLTEVTNLSSFTGGEPPQDYEDYRTKLLRFIGDPQSGSPSDLKAWIEEVSGVSEATVFVNDNLGTPTNGHNTIRISGPGATIPDAGVITAAQAAIDLQNLANITNHVTTFDPHSIDVEVTVTVDPDFTIDDVTPEVEEAIANYVNYIPVSETVYVSGIIDAVFGLAGVINVSVDDPVADVTSTSLEKPVIGTVTVNEAP